ncbi:hypothetical protein Clo1100_1507 [Clostridium sp. BNL1100]|nr:hypothetical protein Clo1100_1507 [Clostridium sp. BNL1100]
MHQIHGYDITISKANKLESYIMKTIIKIFMYGKQAPRRYIC